MQVSTSTKSATAMLFFHFHVFEPTPVVVHLDLAGEFLQTLPARKPEVLGGRAAHGRRRIRLVRERLEFRNFLVREVN